MSRGMTKFSTRKIFIQMKTTFFPKQTLLESCCHQLPVGDLFPAFAQNDLSGIIADGAT